MRADSSLARLWRVFCQPSAFAQETRGWGAWRRLGFMLRIMPAMAVAQGAVVGLVALAVSPALKGIDLVPWLRAGGIGLGVGVAWGVVWSVLMGAAWGVVAGPVAWAAAHAGVPLLGERVPAGLASALATGIPLGLVSGIALGVALRTAKGALWGLGLGIAFGIVVGSEGRSGGLVELLSRFLIGYSGVFIVSLSFLVGYFRLEWYPVDAGATLWQLWRARRAPAQAQALFRRSPIYWREPIWAPLAGLKQFLHVMDECDPEAALEECLFVILERPTQARWARAALMEIGARHMAAPNTVREIAAIAEGEGGTGVAVLRAGIERARLPGPLAKAGPEFEELVRHAEQHVAATLPHNRRRALERLRDGSERLATELAMAGDRYSELWAGVARKWHDLAEERLAELGEAEEASGYIPNPFVFGQPIEETETNLFVGRRGVVREIEQSLLGVTQKPALVLWGPRRMGKTSVLLQLPRMLGEEFVPAFLDMQAMQVRESVTAFFRSLSMATSAGLQRRGVGIEPLHTEALERAPFSTFAEWMESVEKRLGEKRYLLLCLDEFERLETSIREGKLPIELMDQIRHMVQHHPRVVLLFAGSHRPDEMELNWPDALISTRTIRVSYLREEEARELVTRPVPGFPVRYGEGTVDRVLEMTRCQPYLVQAVCFELVNVLNASGRREVGEQEVEEATELALESTHLYLAEMWRQLDETEQRVARRVAEREGGVTAEALGGGSEANAKLRRMEARSILERRGEPAEWRFQVPMVREWVRRREAEEG